MTRFVSLSLMILGLFIASVGCGGSDKPTMVAPTTPHTPDAIEQEMESDEYEKGMNELGNE